MPAPDAGIDAGFPGFCRLFFSGKAGLAGFPSGKPASDAGIEEAGFSVTFDAGFDAGFRRLPLEPWAPQACSRKPRCGLLSILASLGTSRVQLKLHDAPARCHFLGQAGLEPFRFFSVVVVVVAGKRCSARSARGACKKESNQRLFLNP